MRRFRLSASRSKLRVVRPTARPRLCPSPGVRAAGECWRAPTGTVLNSCEWAVELALGCASVPRGWRTQRRRLYPCGSRSRHRRDHTPRQQHIAGPELAGQRMAGPAGAVRANHSPTMAGGSHHRASARTRSHNASTRHRCLSNATRPSHTARGRRLSSLLTHNFDSDLFHTVRRSGGQCCSPLRDAVRLSGAHRTCNLATDGRLRLRCRCPWQSRARAEAAATGHMPQPSKSLVGASRGSAAGGDPIGKGFASRRRSAGT